MSTNFFQDRGKVARVSLYALYSAMAAAVCGGFYKTWDYTREPSPVEKQFLACAKDAAKEKGFEAWLNKRTIELRSSEKVPSQTLWAYETGLDFQSPVGASTLARQITYKDLELLRATLTSLEETTNIKYQCNARFVKPLQGAATPTP